MRIHSVENRFIAILSGALLVFVVPLFVLFLAMSSDRSAREALDRGQIMLNANSKALGKPLWDLDEESVRQITRAIVSGGAVAKVIVRDSSGSIEVEIPSRPLPRHISTAKVASRILYESLDGSRDVGTIEMQIEQKRFLSGGDWRELVFSGIFVISVLIIFLTAIFGSRILVTRPLLKLTAAIEATRRLGSRHQVDWKSDDEIGQLAANFNEMQARLADEEMGLRDAHKQATDIYNHTPAMLYSVDGNDRIVAVSAYWLMATGYQRADVIGCRFEELVDTDCRDTYRTRLRLPDSSVTVKFCCASGELIDIMIREAAIETAGEIGYLSVMTDVSGLKEAETRNLIQAITDHLTGLPNRQGFETALQAMIAEADRDKSEVGCLFVDLDRFKWINDNLGHAAGDMVLRQVVSRIRAQLRPHDTVARLGGDEFAILIAAGRAAFAASEISNRIIRALEAPFLIEGRLVSLSASIGVALYPVHAGCAADLLQKSDIAMYARKRDGKNGMQFFDPGLENAFRRRAKIEEDIADGLREDWFEAWLQPVYDLKSMKVVGFEALMRMAHPKEGILPPAEIIQIAEESGTIRQIGNRIFEHAVEGFADLIRQPAFADCYLAVNFSPLQFEPGMLEKLTSVLMLAGVHPSRITVEVTEAVLMQHNPLIGEIFAAMRAAGFRIALDDFGTGYSSLSYLHRFPVDIVKVDQSFTRALSDEDDQTRGRSRLLVEGILAISHQLDCKVIAEGVETRQQHDALRAIGVDCGQGYFFCRPMRSDDLADRFAVPQAMAQGA